MRRVTTLLMSLALLGCTSDIDDRTDDTSEEPDPATLDWSGVQAIVDQGLADNDVGVDGMVLVVVDSETDQELLRYEVGELDASQTIAVASASKMVSGLVLGRLVTEGDLSLDDTTADVLGWEGRHGEITLDQLGAFTSGLPTDNLCTLRPNITLEQCVDAVYAASLTADPGTRLEYGSLHLAVAGRMAEVTQDEGWNSLFDDMLKGPLGLDDPEQTYFTLPKQAGTDGDNPLIAGGLRSSVDDFLPFVRLIDDRGIHEGEVLIDVAMVDRMFKNPYSTARIGQLPTIALDLAWRYGWAGWLECPGQVTECDVFSSPGAFGFTPWVDREHGYYAILAMESPAQGGASVSVQLEQALQDEIVITLGR